jgi:hypothetical protein
MSVLQAKRVLLQPIVSINKIAAKQLNKTIDNSRFMGIFLHSDNARFDGDLNFETSEMAHETIKDIFLGKFFRSNLNGARY